MYRPTDFVFYKFVATAAGFVTKVSLSYFNNTYRNIIVNLFQSLTQTMIALCELYTEEPDGGSAAIPARLFVDLYAFLAAVEASREHRFLDGQLWGESYNA